MRLPLVFKLVVALVLCAYGMRAQTRLTNVDPAAAKPGDVVTANGEAIDRASVEQLFLTDGTNDFACEVTDQTAKAIKFKVPADIKKGRWALMIRIKGGQLMQQPVRLTVE